MHERERESDKWISMERECKDPENKINVNIQPLKNINTGVNNKIVSKRRLKNIGIKVKIGRNQIITEAIDLSLFL